MHEITSDNACEYLHASGRIAASEAVNIEELVGGVSNVVLLVELPDRGERFVLKQARSRLRVKEEWLCPVERIWREVDVLRICGNLVHPSVNAVKTLVPTVFWEDPDNFAYAMTAAPPEHRTWKELLFAGMAATSNWLAIACGALLGQLHAGSWGDNHIAARLADRSYFDQLRLDPYYRQIGRVHPDLSPQTQGLIDSAWQHRRCLVHGDFSPKNLLVWPGNVMLIDFEVGHYGDPAFDLGFFLTHLVCKSVWAGPRGGEYIELGTGFWNAYRATISTSIAEAELKSLEQRTMGNLAGCLLARVDGKSPVDYLSSEQQHVVRELARQWLTSSPPTWDDGAARVLRDKY